MSYGIHTLKRTKKIIENIQSRATRMIPELKKLSYTDRLQHLKLFSMDYRRKRGDTIQLKGAQWLSGRVLDSRPKGRGFMPHRRHCVVVLEQDTFILA